MKKNILFSAFMFVGRKKWRAYFFWYLSVYFILIINTLIKCESYIWEMFFPLKLMPLLAAYFYGPIHYRRSNGESPQTIRDEMLAPRKMVKYILGGSALLISVATLSKILHVNLTWFII